ncbi:MAG: isopentenyl phosphate kinase [Methanomassiliicoccales archaeon]|jgi:isopentenyl phosphate kinase
MMIVKLGGSVITHKGRYRSFRRDVTKRLAGEIAGSGERVIVVHGAGSFGHLLAAKHALHEGRKDEKQIPALARVMRDVRDLDQKVLAELQEAFLPAVSIPPAACARMKGGVLKSLDTKLFRAYTELGAMPVTFGDVVLDETKGFSICSGDQLIRLLTKEFAPERVVFCADVDGVCSSDPKTDKCARLLRTVDSSCLDSVSKGTCYVDVTGGMHGKLSNMLEIAKGGADVMVINGLEKGRLKAALQGKEPVGTRVVGV